MNTKGEFEVKPLSFLLGIIGAVITLFTINGGFSSGWAAGQAPSFMMKAFVTLAGFAVGFIWGSMME